MAKPEIAQTIRELMNRPEQIRNIGIVAHIDHGKTTLTDNLLAGAGMMSEEAAGHQLVMDFVEQEQERGITIYAANVSMVHNVGGKEYLINLIDTPLDLSFLNTNTGRLYTAGSLRRQKTSAFFVRQSYLMNRILNG